MRLCWPSGWGDDQVHEEGCQLVIMPYVDMLLPEE